MEGERKDQREPFCITWEAFPRLGQLTSLPCPVRSPLLPSSYSQERANKGTAIVLQSHLLSVRHTTWHVLLTSCCYLSLEAGLIFWRTPQWSFQRPPHAQWCFILRLRPDKAHLCKWPLLLISQLTMSTRHVAFAQSEVLFSKSFSVALRIEEANENAQFLGHVHRLPI